MCSLILLLLYSKLLPLNMQSSVNLCSTPRLRITVKNENHWSVYRIRKHFISSQLNKNTQNLLKHITCKSCLSCSTKSPRGLQHTTVPFGDVNLTGPQSMRTQLLPFNRKIKRNTNIQFLLGTQYSPFLYLLITREMFAWSQKILLKESDFEFDGNSVSPGVPSIKMHPHPFIQHMLSNLPCLIWLVQPCSFLDRSWMDHLLLSQTQSLGLYKIYGGQSLTAPYRSYLLGNSFGVQ